MVLYKQKGDNDMYWKYEVIQGLNPDDPTKIVSVLTETQRTFSVSENKARIAELQKESGELQAEIDATKDEKNILAKSVIQLKEELK